MIGEVMLRRSKIVPSCELQLVAGQLVADEEIVDQELQLVAVELDEVAPPFLELEIALRPGIDVGVDLVLLAPQPVGRVQAVEVQDQPGSVELAVAEIAGHRGEPAAAEQAAGIAHRVLAVHALPVRHRRARDQARPEQVRPQHGDHQRLIARLAIADGERTRRIGMELDHPLEEFHLSFDDVKELLAGRGLRPEADEIDRMTRIQGVADLALRLEAADARALAGARVDHHDRPLARVGCDPRRRHDARKRIVDRPRQRPAAHQHFVIEAQHGRHRARRDLDLFIAALAAAGRGKARCAGAHRPCIPAPVPWRCRGVPRRDVREQATQGRTGASPILKPLSNSSAIFISRDMFHPRRLFGCMPTHENTYDGIRRL